MPLMLRPGEFSRAPAQWGAVYLVSQRGFARVRPPDAHEPGVLSGTSGSIFAVGAVLTGPLRHVTTAGEPMHVRWQSRTLLYEQVANRKEQMHA